MKGHVWLSARRGSFLKFLERSMIETDNHQEADKKGSVGPVARILVSANRGLRGFHGIYNPARLALTMLRATQTWSLDTTVVERVVVHEHFN